MDPMQKKALEAMLKKQEMESKSLMKELGIKDDDEDEDMKHLNRELARQGKSIYQWKLLYPFLSRPNYLYFYVQRDWQMLVMTT